MGASGAATLASLVDYQAGGIVSRQILKKPAGNVTLFAFDEREELTEHTSPFDALVHLIEGEATVTIGGTSHRVGQGQMILLPAGVPHAVKAAGRFKMLLTMIRA
jgi:quercetin dioxygenase-like cupin family protein